MRSLRFLVGLLVVLVTAVPAAAQTAEGVEITDVNTARYPRVTMVVEVQNASQLDPAALAVTENGQTAGELTVEKIGESAVEVGIVLTIDTSGSMDGAPMEAAKRAALSFVTQMRSQDRVAIVGFGDQVTVYAPFTNSKRLLATAIDQLAATGETSLYDAVETSAQLFSGEAATLERNLILLSDGRDTASAATLEQAVGAVEDQQVRVFGVALQSPDFDPAPVQQIVQAGDGLYLETPEPGRLTDLYGRIQRELDNRLVVRFTATQQQAGDLQIGVAYGNVATQTVVAVPGFATTLAPVATAPPAPKVVSVPSRAVADPGTLMAIAVAAAALASIFVVIIFAGPPREGGSARRLAAFGRRQAVEEKRSFIGRIPLLRRFSEQAEAVAKKRGLLGALNTALEQADIPLSPGEAVAGAMAGAVVLGLAVGLMATSVLLGLLAFVVGVLLVLSAVRFIGAREKRRFENQLPDTLTLISTSLRAGYSLLQAVEAVAEESPSPTSREFARAIAESRLGRPVVAAMQAMGQRMQSADFTWAVMAIEIQREVGGNLAEVLQIVADTMRQRNRLKGEIRALTAEGRISAVVLAMLPIGMFAFLWVSNRSYLEPLLTNSVGWLAIGAGIMAMGIGIYWMRKIVNIEV